MYKEEKILKKSLNLNSAGEIFLENVQKILKKNFFDDEKNVEYYETTMRDIFSMELATNEDDLKTLLLKSNEFFNHRSYEEHGNVSVPSPLEMTIEKFKNEIKKVKAGDSIFTLFNINKCKEYFQTDCLLYNKHDR
jgi:hypothetical protein